MRGPKAPPLPIARRRDSFTALALATLLFAGCAAAGDAGREATTQLQQSPGKAEDFMIVDCLLPGQIRRLGAQVTFLTARRAIKTSTRDCEIRGGEYVAFDRSNYATALKIWLPLAKEGDASAQTYVGEIFEKGLGVPPDHAAAAEWYRRAAESGYARAAINLGHLSERGLG
ncbi:MAG: sel1 repeat family protein, partial [Candidatus Rokubacteria bacterium]|nr:sel1 repeat family protein [Candidatus Rokubacteria bacterium]